MIELIQGHTLDVLSRFSDDRLFDAVITDPPYASGSATQSGITASTSKKYTNSKVRCPFPDFEGDAMDKRSWANMMTRVFQNARERTVKGGVIVIFVDWRQLPSITDILQWSGWIWRGVLPWDKGNCRPQKGRFKQQAEFIVWGSNGALPITRPVPCLPGVFRHPNVAGKERLHQTQKPIDLMRDIVKICVPHGHILDPFAGSGSTLVAAHLEGYHATGLELSNEIYQTALDRLKMEGFSDSLL